MPNASRMVIIIRQRAASCSQYCKCLPANAASTGKKLLTASATQCFVS